jgi:HEAT repeats
VPRWFDRGSGVEGLADRLDWRPLASSEDDGWETAWEASPATRVTWWEDDETGIQYALVEGPDAPAVEAAIRDALDILRPETYAAAVAAEGTPMGRGHLLLAVAVAAPTPDDPAARAVLMEALADANPFVRRYASLAAGALGSDELLAVVAKLAATDPDPDVRATAAEVGDPDRR